MTRQIQTKLKRIAAVTAVSATALTLLIGATRSEWSIVGKDDRVPSVADCRKAEMKSDDFCSGVKLPETTTEAYQVMPGLSIIEQVEARS
ncbi:hypothetical protein [Chthonobacter rhizosphaerae]|uniref:hypothetical protein n=1 Tax=Chthonobacter rhizosphaerae TaxID=2735553 RepID=UPI0015EF4099|nr:hypothetical protein [Chthonobacter rhizosphaerae]